MGGYQENCDHKENVYKNLTIEYCGKIIEEDKEIATNFNEFFVNVGPSTENTIPKVPNILPSKFLRNRNQINFVIAHISNENWLK